MLYGTSKIVVSLDVAVTTTSSMSLAVSSSLSWATKVTLNKNIGKSKK